MDQRFRPHLPSCLPTFIPPVMMGRVSLKQERNILDIHMVADTGRNTRGIHQNLGAHRGKINLKAAAEKKRRGREEK